MFYSLRFGILLAMLAVAAVAIATITLFAGVTTRVEFTRYLEVGREVREERLQQAVFTYWTRQQEDWEDTPAVLEGLSMLTSSSNQRDMIFMHPGNYRLFAVSRREGLNPNQIPSTVSANDLQFITAPDGSVEVRDGNRVVGVFEIEPINEVELIPAQINFMQSVNRGLLLASGLAAVAAIGLTFVLSRRILSPVAALTNAARRMEQGDLNQRVVIQSQGEIAELAYAFNAMAEALNRNEELRRKMVGDIAHELRTPLTNIRGYLEALQDGVVAPDENAIGLIYEEAMVLHRLIQDLQELALAEAGQLRFVKQPFSLCEVVEHTVGMFQPTATSKNLRIHAAISPDLPQVIADPRRVGQVLRNLLSNAVTHTPDHGCIYVEADLHETEVEIHIRDTGTGIAQEHLPYLFERFYRVDPSRSRVTGGAGLGLAIVKQLVEAQGGRVQVESIPDQGTTFSFTLPVYQPNR